MEIQHAPLTYPPAAHGIQLTDRKEATTVQDRPTAYREMSGKGATLIAARAGAFHAGRVDGVPYVVDGAAGEPFGGFAGWSLWSMSSEERPRAQFLPRTETVDLAAPGVVGVGSSAAVEASISQDGRTVPIRYPMAATWSGSDELYTLTTSP